MTEAKVISNVTGDVPTDATVTAPRKSPLRDRRAFLSAVAGAGVGAAAAAIAAPVAVLAGPPGPPVPTFTTDDADPALRAISTGSGEAVLVGKTDAIGGHAVFAVRNGAGDGDAMAGIRTDSGAGHAVSSRRSGSGEGDAIISERTGSGHGAAVAAYKHDDGTGFALFGHHDGTAEGDALFARRTNDGPGAAVHAVGDLGLLVEGRSRFSSAGVGSIEAGSSAGAVEDLTNVDVSNVLVTLLTDPGGPIAVSWVDRTQTSFTVHLTGDVAHKVFFGYFLIESV